MKIFRALMGTNDAVDLPRLPAQSLPEKKTQKNSTLMSESNNNKNSIIKSFNRYFSQIPRALRGGGHLTRRLNWQRQHRLCLSDKTANGNGDLTQIIVSQESSPIVLYFYSQSSHAFEPFIAVMIMIII